MAENSEISWTHHTFNHVRGCTKVSAGCANCYAEAFSGRNPGTLGVWGPNGTRVVAAESMWREPLKWNRKAAAAGERHRVFCASLADVFEGIETMPKDAREPVKAARIRLFALIDATPHLDWLLLTKRPENITSMMRRATGGSEPDEWLAAHPNVWIGTSVENQAAADERVPHLLRVPARVRFLSMEPLLGAVDLSQWTDPNCPACHTGACMTGPVQCPPRVSWVIVGGESGPDARPMHPDWARSLRDQCVAAGAPFHFKQWGEWCPSDIAPKPEPEPTTIFKGTPAECVVMKRPPVSFQVVKPDGGDRLFNVNGTFSGEGPTAADCWMHRVGKKAAGRLLDGRTWDEFPTTHQE